MFLLRLEANSSISIPIYFSFWVITEWVSCIVISYCSIVGNKTETVRQFFLKSLSQKLVLEENFKIVYFRCFLIELH